MKEDLLYYLNEHIPIAKAMGVEVVHASPDKVVLFAPHANNVNHKRTVFGGSLHAIATLACWSLVHLNLQHGSETPYHIVITHSEVDYLAPVDADFTITCLKPPESEWHRFMKILQAKGKSRITLSAQLQHKDKLCVDYRGDFAALSIN